MNTEPVAMSACGSVAHMLLGTAASAGNKVAVISGEHTVSYADLAARAQAIAETLVQAGIKPGDRVAIMLRRGAEAASAFFGVVAAGAIAVVVRLV